jgi:hypothetical protein
VEIHGLKIVDISIPLLENLTERGKNAKYTDVTSKIKKRWNTRPENGASGSHQAN